MNILLSKTDSYIFSLLKILLAACLMTPLLAWSGVIFPYTVPKIFAFRALVEIAAVFYFYLALKYPALRLSFFSRHCDPAAAGEGNPVDSGKISGSPRSPRLRGSLAMTITAAVLFFLFVNFLSAIFGIDFYASFWGGLERLAGVWGLAHFAAWFFMLAAVFREKKDWIGLIKLSAAVSLVVVATALIQRFGGLGGLLPATDRVYGLIGNAGVLAGYLIFNIFLAGYLAVLSLRGAERRSNPADVGRNTGSPRVFDARDDKIRFIVYCLLLSVNCFVLLLTGTRGAYLGLAAGAVVFLVLMVFPPKLGVYHPELVSGSTNERSRNKFGMTNKRFLFALILGVVLILAGSLFLFRNSAFIKNDPALFRLTRISLSDATTQSRLILWQDAWRAWQARPLLGFGPANFEAAVGPYLSPRLISFEAYAFDRAHNFILDYGVAGGWLGLISYLAILGAAIRTLWQRRTDDFLFFVVFASLLAAYLAQNFFIFDSFVSYLMLFFVLALINNVSLRGAPLRSSGAAQQSNPEVLPPSMGLPRPFGARNDNLSIFKKIVFLFAVICLLLAVYSFNFKPLYAGYLANQILSLPAAQAQVAASLLGDALSLDTFASPEIVYQAAIDYTEKINQNPALAQNEEFYNLAAEKLTKLIDRSPNQPRNHVALAWLNLYFSGQQPTRINEAIDLGNKIIKLIPTKKDAYLILAAGYALSHQPLPAQEIILRAAAIDGKMGEEIKNYWNKLK